MTIQRSDDIYKVKYFNIRIFIGELNGGCFGYVPDAFSNNLPELPSESSRSSRSAASSINECIISEAGSSRSGSPGAE